ncbi:N-alpha-acetyltransferase 30 [Quaeritorhiza haematococci]|nr:N-alpha-acetyltransferase 30 [Quaeritorhiza haematococci]
MTPTTTPTASSTLSDSNGGTAPPSETEIAYVPYENEHQLPAIMRLVSRDLSEPYSIYTYRYFIHHWPGLCFLAMDGDKNIGVIICKLDRHLETMRGYIAMLAVAKEYRKRRIGSTLVNKAVSAMKEQGADEVVLETENTNSGALALYENLGFVRDKRLSRYYLNGVDAFRLKLWLK